MSPERTKERGRKRRRGQSTWRDLEANFSEVYTRIAKNERSYIREQTSKIRSHVRRIIDHYEDHLAMEERKSKDRLDSIHRRLFGRVVLSVLYRVSLVASAYRRLIQVLEKHMADTVLGDFQLFIGPGEHVVSESTAILLDTGAKLGTDLRKELFSLPSGEVNAWNALLLPEDVTSLAECYWRELVSENLVLSEARERGATNPGSRELLIRLIKATAGGYLIGHDLVPPLNIPTIATGIYMATSAFDGLSLQGEIAKRRHRRRTHKLA